MSDHDRCQCGYKLVNGRCPIPCGGKSLAAEPERPAKDASVIYWTPKEAAA